MEETQTLSNANSDTGELTFWDGVASVAALIYVMAAIVRVVTDPISATHFYASVFRALAISILLVWGIAVFARKWHECRSGCA
jgi:hypothetical protein